AAPRPPHRVPRAQGGRALPYADQPAEEHRNVSLSRSWGQLRLGPVVARQQPWDGPRGERPSSGSPPEGARFKDGQAVGRAGPGGGLVGERTAESFGGGGGDHLLRQGQEGKAFGRRTQRWT